MPCPDHGFSCPGSPGRLPEGRERYELDALSWQGHRLGLDELQRPGETPWVMGLSQHLGWGTPQRSDTGTWGTWGARTVGCQDGRGVLVERPSACWGDVGRAEGQWGSWHKAARVGGDRWHSWGHEPWAARSHESGIRL